MFIDVHHTLAASATAQMPVIVHAGIPIIPVLLLPFIIIFFVVVFPLWGLSLGVLGLLLIIARGLSNLGHRAGVETFDGSVARIHRAFRWVLTFGGFTERGKDQAPS